MFSSDQMGHELLPMILDVEASGFGRGSYPIEVGFVMPDGTPHCTLIRPPEHWTHWCEEAEQMHQISRETLFKYGKSCYEAAHWLNSFLRGHIVYSDAWGHDLSWLGTLFEEAELPQLFKLESLTALLSECQMKCWADTRREVFDRICMQRHRASTDARVIQLTYFYSRAGLRARQLADEASRQSAPHRVQIRLNPAASSQAT